MTEAELYITKQRKGQYLILDLYIGEQRVSHLLAIYPDWDSKRMYISDLKTNEGYRRKGYATQLIRRAIWEAERNGCNLIKLDDCSDGYGSSSNIYLKNGFRYGILPPEMYLELVEGIV